MALLYRTLALIALLSAPAGAAVAQANPLQKVVQLLSDLEKKIKADGEKEVSAYEEYSAFCTKDAREKGFEIKTATAEIDELSATITKATTDAAGASTKIEELSADIANNEADLKAAKEIRSKERADFQVVEGELVDTVDTLQRAINVLERKGAALLQANVNMKDISQVVQALSVVLDAAAVSIQDQKRLVALVQSASSADDDEDAPGAPAAKAYESHSGGIIDLLDDLLGKATAELAKVRKQETTSNHNYEMLRQSLEDELVQENKETRKAKALKAASLETKATSENDLAQTKKDLAATQAALGELNTACEAAAADHKASMASRAEELKALATAKQVIVEKTGAAEDIAYSSLVQVTSEAELANAEVTNLVRQLAKKTGSTALSQLAKRIAALMRHGAVSGEDPFAKIKGLIRDLLDKLKKEAGADAEHKAYCDDQMAKTKEKMGDLRHTVQKLTAKSDQQKARSATLKEEVAELQRELAAIANSQAEMDKIREEEHALFVQTKADLEEGLDGVRLALKVLREHYEGKSLVQEAPPVPTYHENSSGGATGIIGLLEVIESDLGKNLAEAQMQEDSAAEEYAKVTQENKVTTATKEQDVKYKSEEATGLDKSVGELTADLEGAQTELDAVLEYMKGLREKCVEKPETYEERSARRQAEIAGLKEALEILNSQAALLQRGGKGLRGTSRW